MALPLQRCSGVRFTPGFVGAAYSAFAPWTLAEHRFVILFKRS